jgi:hypothetical protein
MVRPARQDLRARYSPGAVLRLSGYGEQWISIQRLPRRRFRRKTAANAPELCLELTRFGAHAEVLSRSAHHWAAYFPCGAS